MNAPKQFVQDGKVRTFSRVNLSMLKVGDRFQTVTGAKKYEVLDGEGLVRDLETGKEGWFPQAFPCFKLVTL